MLKWGLMELLREREKGVLRAAHPRTPFQGEHPPGMYREILDFQCQLQQW